MLILRGERERERDFGGRVVQLYDNNKLTRITNYKVLINKSSRRWWLS
jgi:hypothetical protein